jgi:hypothetical protein
MTLPGRESAVATLKDGDGRLWSLFDRIDDEQMVVPRTIGGGDWSAKDLMGHVAFWEELAIDALNAIRAGRRPAVEALFARGIEGIDEANAQNQERTAAASVEEVRARARVAHETCVKAIEAMDDDEWRARVPYEAARRETTAELLGSIMGAPKKPFGHAFAHLEDLAGYVQTL